ncbi:hypothetical protein OROGR_001944 [Orobanche gracilis]
MLCLKTLKALIRNPKFRIPVSYIHNRSSKNPSLYNPAIQFILDEVQECQSSKARFSNPVQREGEESFSSPVQNEEQEILHQKQHKSSSSIQISHPWSEWVDFMERLLRDGYFDEVGNPFASNRELGNKESNLIRTASLNFARDHYQLIRYLSRKDIVVIAGSGCPSIDRKVVNSGKRLRAHVGINEGNVCSSCILRGDCDRAYVKAREDEGGRTVDVVRFLSTYGLGSVENKPCLNKKVKESVRTLLKEIVDTNIERNDCEERKSITREWTPSILENEVRQERTRSDVPMKQGDWICPKCNFLNFARNLKCLRCDDLFDERLKKIAEEQENLPLKKGDWICDKCNFLNFARNTRCLQCKEKPPKRQINPGEWECDSCNYINFKRNMVCLKCDHKRPIPSSNAGIASQTANNDVKSHQMRAWFGQLKQSGHEGGRPLDFVETESEGHASSSSLEEVPNFMHFPVVGGKSDLSRDVERQQLWKIEMAEKSRNEGRPRKDSFRHDSYDIRGGMKEYLISSDDDDDMSEWFEGVKKSG